MSKRHQLHKHSLPLLIFSFGALLVSAILLTTVQINKGTSDSVVWQALFGQQPTNRQSAQANNGGATSVGLEVVNNAGLSVIRSVGPNQ